MKESCSKLHAITFFVLPNHFKKKMTTAPVHTYVVLDLCDRAIKEIVSKIKKCPVSEPPYFSSDELPDPEEYFAYETLKDWYKDLNFVLRIKELCKLAQGSSSACIDLSLDTYTKLVIWAGGAIVYSPDNPIA